MASAIKQRSGGLSNRATEHRWSKQQGGSDQPSDPRDNGAAKRPSGGATPHPLTEDRSSDQTTERPNNQANEQRCGRPNNRATNNPGDKATLGATELTVKCWCDTRCGQGIRASSASASEGAMPPMSEVESSPVCFRSLCNHK